MTTAELKTDLINQIKVLSDEVRLKELQNLMNFYSNDAIYTTNAEEKAAIYDAQKQILNEEVFTNEDVQKEFKSWLKE